jgi:hypothetical protein
MDERRLTPLMGVVSVVLFVISVFVIESGDTPGEEATGADVAAYYDGALGELAVSVVLWGLGTIALVWFLDGLRAHISTRSDQLGRLTFYFGFGVALFMLASLLPEVAGALASDNLDRPLESGAAEAIASLGDGFFIGAEALLVGLFLFAALAALWARALPAWLGWVSLVLAIIALIPPIGWAVVVFGLPLWILIVSGVLWRGGELRPAGGRPA